MLGGFYLGGLVMRLENAKRLHNDDEVILKGSEEVVKVLNAYLDPSDPKVVLIEVSGGGVGYAVVNHFMVR